MTVPDIADWQERFVQNVKKVIENNYFFGKPKLRILDTGCDPTGKQLWKLAGLTSGEIIGINIKDGFPTPEALRQIEDRPNAKLIHMDALNVQFPDESFDMTISANIMEHIRDPRRYVQECRRVLKKTGIAYFESYPIWTSARGHHIMENMINDSCCKTEIYRNDGSFIPDWSHLSFSEIRMRTQIENKLKPETVDWICNYLYHSDDLNKKGWSEIYNIFKDNFVIYEAETSSDSTADVRLKPSDGLDHYDVAGFTLIAGKKAEGATTRIVKYLARRVYRRLRLLRLALFRRLK